MRYRRDQTEGSRKAPLPSSAVQGGRLLVGMVASLNGGADQLSLPRLRRKPLRFVNLLLEGEFLPARMRVASPARQGGYTMRRMRAFLSGSLLIDGDQHFVSHGQHCLFLCPHPTRTRNTG